MRRDANAVSPVVAVILLLGITIVLAASVYLVATNLVQDVNATRPYVGLAITASNQTQATIVVAEISQANLGLGNFAVLLMIDDTEDGNSTLWPLESGIQGRIAFISFDTYFSAGDRFVIALDANHSYSLRIIQINGGFQIGQVDWQA